ncbi:hypothetical protein ACODM8_02275 [Vibrio ostreicida]|uniref:hypothetical protein n=1 Tax=Vibrio ostreicida TaxID=526588 RepID=UPI00097112CE|nr:hypothetical protein [Vibrio ostreicida]
MHPQQLLIELASQYDVQTANQALADARTRQFARAWLAIDLSRPLSAILHGDLAGFGLPYVKGHTFYRYCRDSRLAEACEKRVASKADLVVTVDDRLHFFEFHYLHHQCCHRTAWQKLYQDVERVRVMQSVTEQKVNLIVALWGTFTGKHIEMFQWFDNNQNAVYALDSSLSGSSQVSRLVHIQKSGHPRLILVVV